MTEINSTVASFPRTAIAADKNPKTVMESKVLQKRWRCDVCHVKWFLDFEEACRHEAACKDSSSDTLTTSSLSMSSNETKESSENVIVFDNVGARRKITPQDTSKLQCHAKDIPFANIAEFDSSEHVIQSHDSIPINESGVSCAGKEFRPQLIREADTCSNERNSSSTLLPLRMKNCKQKKKVELTLLLRRSTTAQARSKLSQATEVIDMNDKEENDIAAGLIGSCGPRHIQNNGSDPNAMNSHFFSNSTLPCALGDNTESPGLRRSKRHHDVTLPKPNLQGESVEQNDGPRKSAKKETGLSYVVRSNAQKQTPLASTFLQNQDQMKPERSQRKPETERTEVNISRQSFAEHFSVEKFVVGRRWRSDPRARLCESARDRAKYKSENNSSEVQPIAKAGCSKSTHAPLAKSVILQKNILAEHNVASFFARRKLENAEERARQKKRNQLRKQRIDQRKAEANIATEAEIGHGPRSALDANKTIRGNCEALSSPRWQLSRRSETVGTSKRWPAAIRFPRPSHHLLSHDVEYSDATKRTDLLPCAEQLRKTPKFQYRRSVVTSMIGGVDSKNESDLRFRGPNDGTIHVEGNYVLDTLSSIFRQPVKSRKHRKTSQDGLNTQVWVDKYAMKHIPFDVLGSQNKKSACKLIEFIEGWKHHRYYSARRRANLEALRCGGRKKKRSCGYDSDDLFLDDADDDDKENVFLLTGPSGSGKTNLVHAVAEQCACVVLEINSADRRGGQALKRAVQESTLCHSSLAILKRGNVNTRGFTTTAEMSNNDNNNDIDDDDYGLTMNAHYQSLTIVLIDEVDLLFENDGDSGFWPALTQLSQKAKCPIVLTSTELPIELSSLRYMAASLQRPSPDECVAKIEEVSKSEGLQLRHKTNAAEKALRFSLIAEACQCDIRKMINEMQLFSQCTDVVINKKQHVKFNCHDHLLKPNQSYHATEEGCPVIVEIEPTIVPNDRYSLIKITGRNFDPVSCAVQRQQSAYLEAEDNTSASQVELFIGGEKCRNFFVVSNCTIIAVCPPCILPKGVSKSAKYENSSLDCLSSKFPEIFIKTKIPYGRISSSTNHPPQRSDENSVESPICRATWNIQYDIPIEESLIEHCIDKEALSWTPRAGDRTSINLARDEIKSEDQKSRQLPLVVGNSQQTGSNNGLLGPRDLLDKAIVEYKTWGALARDQSITNSLENCGKKVLGCSAKTMAKEMDFFAGEIAVISDIVLLKESTQLALPLKSGAIKGLGSNSDGPLSTQSFAPVGAAEKLIKGWKMKPPSFESIFTSGANESEFFFGNSDAYMTHPARRRDRQLLSLSSFSSRGLGYLDDNYVTEISDANSRSLDGETNSLPFRQEKICSEDDVLPFPSLSSSFCVLPSLLPHGLERTRKHGFIVDQSPLLQLRRAAMSKKTVDILQSVCLGTCLGSETIQRSGLCTGMTPLNVQLSLDYLPYLRAIAFYECKVMKFVAKSLEGETAKKTTRKTRTSNKGVRRHYFEALFTKGPRDEPHLQYISTELAKLYM